VDALIANLNHFLHSLFRTDRHGRLLLPCWSLLVGLTCSGMVAADQCPAGQQRLCVGMCFCAPVDSALFKEANRVLGAGLRNWVMQSRERALSGEVMPMPENIRRQLQAYFEPSLLNLVRYRVGDGIENNLTHVLLQNQDVSAVTLVDLIVFQNAGDAQNNVALWAHELTHVEQYQQLGVDEFSARYVRDYISLESPAYQMQSRVSYDLKQAAEAAALVGDGND